MSVIPSVSRVAVIVAMLLASALSQAVVEGYKYPFEDPEQGQRFQRLSEDLRCPKCQNQNLADSHAPVAADMRDKVYELMQEGRSDQDIVDYLVARYGDFVRYNPPFRIETWLLWLGPLLMLVIGFVILTRVRLAQARQQPTPLSDEERARLQALKTRADKS